jgi:hypothetical protein
VVGDVVDDDRRQTFQVLLLLGGHPRQHDRLGDDVDQRSPGQAVQLVRVWAGGQHHVACRHCRTVGAMQRPGAVAATGNADDMCVPHVSALLRADRELRGEHPPRVDEATWWRLAQHRRSGRYDDSIVADLVGSQTFVVDVQFIGDRHDGCDPLGIDLGHQHACRRVERRARRCFDPAIRLDRPGGEDRPLPSAVELAGDPPGVVVAGEHTGVARPVLRLGRPDADARQPCLGNREIPQCRGADEPEPDDGDVVDAGVRWARHAGDPTTSLPTECSVCREPPS